MPGCVHTDLLAAGLIPDPFLDANEDLVQWVADSDWTYSARFAVPDDVRSHDHVDLVFEGLDTLATISFNGSEVATTANMHRTYRFDVAALLADGDNRLTITFASPTRYCDALRAAEGDWPSASFERPYNFLRKMACSWGWDWGPWLTTAGIWRPVSLHGWNADRLVSVRPTASIDGDDHGTVDLIIETVGTEGTINLTVWDPEGGATTQSQMRAHGDSYPRDHRCRIGPSLVAAHLRRATPVHARGRAGP